MSDLGMLPQGARRFEVGMRLTFPTASRWRRLALWFKRLFRRETVLTVTAVDHERGIITFSSGVDRE